MRLLTTVLSTAVFFGGAASAALAQQPGQDEKHDNEVNVQRDANTHRDRGNRSGSPGGLGHAERRKGAYLGVGTSSPTPILREQLKLPEGMGLVVEVVDPGSPADQAGVKRFDVLTKLEDQLLVNAEQLAVLVRSKKPGDEVELTVVRGGAPTQVKAKLAERELAPLEDASFFLRGGPDGRGGVLDWQVREMPPELRDWWTRHRPGTDRAPDAQGHSPAEAHGDHDASAATATARTGQSVTSWTDGEHTLTVTTESDKPGRHLVAKDSKGAVLFDGDLDAPGARDKLSGTLKEKLEKMEAAGVKPPPKAPSPDDARGGHLLPADDQNGI